MMLLCLPLPCTLSAADYRVPRAAYSMCTADLDGDGDNDIVVGHNYCVETGWEGISILINDGFGQFSLLDSLAFLFTWESDVEAYNLNSQSNSDIIALAYSLEQEIASLGIIYDCNLNSIVSYCLNVEWVDSVSGGDIDGDGFLDVVVSQSDGQFWGVLYNDGSGFLSEPVYYSVTGYEPSELACGDLNGDAREDIVICGMNTEIYLSQSEGFERILLEEYDWKDQVRLADMDQDGDHDIVSLLSVGQSAVVMYENIDGYTYIRRDSKIFSPGVGIFVVADINNDTFPDVICEKEPSVYALTNTGDFTLSDPEFTEMTNHGCVFRDLCCSDLDGNGFPDIIVIEYWHYHLPTNLSIKYNDGTGHFLPEPQTAVNDDGDMPYACSLMNYPNPFNDLTRIKFSLRMPCQSVFLQIYNLKGTLIRTLIREGSFDAGLHEIVWDARDNRGIGMGSGVYLSRLAIEDKIITRKMLLVE